MTLATSAHRVLRVAASNPRALRQQHSLCSTSSSRVLSNGTSMKDSFSITGLHNNHLSRHHRPPHARSIFSSSGSNNNSDDNHDPHALFKEQMEQLKREREEVFGFTDDDQNAWSNAGNGKDQLPAALMDSVEQARSELATSQKVGSNDQSHDRDENHDYLQSATTNSNINHDYQPSHGLTHLSEDGNSVHMVNVGHKAVTKRTAIAQTKVILPPEVVSALFKGQTNELMGPKGPIFATAQLAGIMAAKKTSDLIPLCHPLPLDKVEIDIQLQGGNVVVITCECHVTHKTGVEMEALTGASVAALTIYDMTKAISHNIRIEETVLVSKSGGRRTVG